MGMHVNSALPDPAQIKEELPLAPELKALKAKRDAEIRDVFTGVSNKFLVIVGPCSADNEDAVCEYTSRLGELAREVSDKLCIRTQRLRYRQSKGRRSRETCSRRP